MDIHNVWVLLIFMPSYESGTRITTLEFFSEASLISAANEIKIASDKFYYKPSFVSFKK